MKKFKDRTDAGRQLAQHLTLFVDNPAVLIFALPRGGVPIAYEVAQALRAPLDLLLVRKLGVPNHPELALGAIALDDIMFLNQGIITAFNISAADIQAITALEKQELKRCNHLYREDQAVPEVQDKIIIVVDDGLATGATMRAAVIALKAMQPQQIIVAVPVAAVDIYSDLSREVNAVVCLEIQEQLSSIGACYEDFTQVADQTVLNLLAKAEMARNNYSAI